MSSEVDIRSGRELEANDEDVETWWDGRQVAIRPDVPSTAFDPRGLVLVETDAERLQAQSRISRYVSAQKQATSDDALWPSWLCERPDETTERSLPDRPDTEA
jgi:hypothetical protein